MVFSSFISVEGLSSFGLLSIDLDGSWLASKNHVPFALGFSELPSRMYQFPFS